MVSEPNRAIVFSIFFETKFKEKAGIFSLHCCMWVCKIDVFDFGTLDYSFFLFFINLIDVRGCCFGHFNSVIESVSPCRSRQVLLG